jgi:hypothetical protein
LKAESAKQQRQQQQQQEEQRKQNKRKKAQTANQQKQRKTTNASGGGSSGGSGGGGETIELSEQQLPWDRVRETDAAAGDKRVRCSRAQMRVCSGKCHGSKMREGFVPGT